MSKKDHIEQALTEHQQRSQTRGYAEIIKEDARKIAEAARLPSPQEIEIRNLRAKLKEVKKYCEQKGFEFRSKAASNGFEDYRHDDRAEVYEEIVEFVESMP